MKSRGWLLVAVFTLAACTPTSTPPSESAGPSTAFASPSVEPSPTSESSLNPTVTPFPDPVVGQAVYDIAGVLSAPVEASLETEIDAIEARSGAQVVVYLQIDPSATEESNTAAAAALMDQWGIGRALVNDGFVILVSFDDSRLHGKLSTYAGAGLLGPLSTDVQAHLRDDLMLPAFRAGDIEGGIVSGVAFVDEAIP